MKRYLKKVFCIILAFAVLTADSSFVTVHAKTREKESAVNTAQDRGLSVSATNSFGKLLQESVGEQAEEQEDNNGYNVFSVEMSDKTAAVSMEAVEDCTLVVGIYEEDGIKMLATGNKNVTKEEREVTVDIEIDTMPQYYLVRAFLVETDTMDPLCTVYETPMYTKEMQDFLSKTTDDFEEERVLNLDEDKTNNFAVYGEDTKVIKGSDENNCLKCTNEEKQAYVIEKADASAVSLAKGDVFAYEREKEEIVIVKVSSVSAEGSTVMINGEDTDMEDVFEYVKIDETATTEDMEVDASECSEGVEYQGKENSSAGRKKGISGEGSMGVSLSYRFTEDKLPSPSGGNSSDDKLPSPTGKRNPLRGSIALAINTSLKVYVSRQYQYLELTSKYSLANDWKLELKYEREISLGKFGVSPIAGLYIGLEPSFLLEAQTSIGYTGTIEGQIGYSSSPQDGFKDLSSAPSLNNGDTKLEIEGMVFVGFSAEISVTVVTKKLARGSFKGKAGAELQISNDLLETLDDSKEKHDCTNVACFEGEVHARGELTAELKFFDDESLKIEGKVEKKFKLSDLYLCLEHGKFAFTACPEHQYKVTVIAKNPDGTLVKGADVNGYKQTNSYGEAYLWYARGKHTISISKNGNEEIKKVVDVAGKARKITVTFKTNSAVDDGTGGSGDNGDTGDDNGDIELGDNPLAGQKVIKIDKGEGHYGVITESEDLYLWGSNYYNQIKCENALTDKDWYYTPVKVLSDVKDIQLGEFNSLALTNNGDLYDSSQGWSTAILNDIVKFKSEKMDERGALTKYGDLYLWRSFHEVEGENDVVELGAIPVKVLTNVKDFDFHNGIISAITQDNDLYLWGYNAYGQIGDGTTIDKTTPIKILENVKKFNCNGMISEAITNDGDLYRWGYNAYGQIGDGTTIDKTTPIKVLENVKEFSYGYFLSGADDGILYKWGSNGNSQIDNGTTIDKKPIKVLENVKEFSYDSIGGAITNDGDLYMWGYNALGEIGDGTTIDKTTPQKVLENVKEFNCEYFLSGAITNDNTLYLWGKNDEYGQVGNGTVENQKTPYKVLENVISFCVGYADVIALTENGNVYMWGGSVCYPNNMGEYEVKRTPFQINAPLTTKKKTANPKKQLASTRSTTSQIYTWTGRATGWGGPDSYPSSASHEQGTTGVTYDPEYTDITASVGYGCGLELMNPYNSAFTGAENEFAQIVENMKKPCIRVTLENGGTAHGWNWDKEMEFPSGKNVVIPDSYLDTGYLILFGDDDTITNVQIYDAAFLTVSSDGSILSAQSFEDLDADTTYNYYLLKSADVEDVLSGSNVLYIGQGVTDSSGTLSVAYTMKEDCEEPVVILRKFGKNNIADAKVTVSDLQYNQEEQYINPVVSDQGKTLAEGTDYELSGDFSAKDVGTYSVTICGIGDYTGETDQSYDMICSHEFCDWITVKEPTADSTGTQKRTCSLCGYAEEQSIAKLQTSISNGSKGSGTTVAQPSSKKKTVKKPGKVSGLDLSAEGKKLFVSWNWKSGVSGFQIQYALNKKFTKKKKSKNVGKYAQDKTIRGLKKGKTYFVRIRAYKKASGKKIYGKWSKIKKAKMK